MTAEQTGTDQFFALADLSAPMALRVAATLRIADHIERGITNIAALAAATRADRAALSALLRYLTARGVFSCDADGEVGLGTLGAFLTSQHFLGARAWLDLDTVAGRMDRVLFELLGVVRSGEPMYQAVHGRAFWQDLDADPSLSEGFETLMAQQIGLLAAHIVEIYPWADLRRVVDVGGGSGALLAALAQAHPQLTGAVLDLPSAARAAALRFEQLELATRCAAHSGSFFEPLPTPGADAYVLSGVIHDWPDREAVQILQRCADAAGKQGRVLIIEPLLDGDALGFAAAADLRMRALVGGCERSLDDYRALVSRAGLCVGDVRPLPLFNRAIIECRANLT